MSNQANSLNKGLTVKDLVTTGIFTALVFVFVLVGGIVFCPQPGAYILLCRPGAVCLRGRFFC